MKVSTQQRRDRAWAEVSLANLRANARAVQAAAGGARLLPMIKADAYGVGATAVAEALEGSEPWGYGVATPSEAIELREAGVGRPLVVFTPATRELSALYRDYDLRAVIDDPRLASNWELPFHLEIDTGMGRCGVRHDDPRLASITTPHLEGAFTHLCCADESRETVTRQLDRLEQAIELLGCTPKLTHAQNSAGAWRTKRVYDLARPGIFLYGGRCGDDLPAPLPVVQLRARVASIRALHEGESVSYGSEWTTPRGTFVATIGIGYADGVPRAVQRRASVLLGGRRFPIVGRVTMDFVMVDVGPDLGNLRVGDVATLIGRDGDAEITLDEFADWAGSISYEILTGLGQRVAREYVDWQGSEEAEGH